MTDVRKTPRACRDGGADRRDFMVGVAATAAAVSLPFTPAWAADPLDVDVSKLKPGSSLRVNWGGKPVLIRRRAPDEIAAAAAVREADLKDPQSDAARAPTPEWLVVAASCPHKGCEVEEAIPKAGGGFAGWACPCHGAAFDTSGRVLKGPASRNLAVVPHRLINDGLLRLG